MSYAPIVLFCYNRAEHTLETLRALKNSLLSDQSDLYIFADGPKDGCSVENLDKIQRTREILTQDQWCGKVTIYEGETNKGLAANIIDGVTNIVNKYGSVIVLEDDIVVGKYFLTFMNDGLTKYKDDSKIMHLTGFRPEIPTKNQDGCFLYPNMDCWGWATWADRWQFFEKNTDELLDIFSKRMIYKFNMNGAEPGNWAQVVANKEGRLNTWAIFWAASIFLKGGLCIAPCRSVCKNIGFDDSGVHCGANPAEEIHGDIDHKVTVWPVSICIDRTEYGNQIKFYKKKNNQKFTLRSFIYNHCPKNFRIAIQKLIHSN